MSLIKEMQRENILEQLIQMDETVSNIMSDIQAMKGLRSQLLHQDLSSKTVKQGNTLNSKKKVETKPSGDQKKMMSVFFHLVESIVGHVNVITDRYQNNLLSQCPVEVREKSKGKDIKATEK